MAIAEDASAPASMTATNSTVAATTTASFTPPANSLLVAMYSNAWNATYSGTPANMAFSDSASGTWTQINTASEGSAGSNQMAIAYRIVSTSVAMTVTATSIDALAKNKILTVRVLTGTALSGTIATSLFTGTGTTAGFIQRTVTTTTTGSKPIIVAASNANDSLAVNANTTEYGRVNDTVVNAICVTGRATNLTGTPGSISLGWTGSTATGQSVAVAEIMPAVAAVAPPPDRSYVMGNSLTSQTLMGMVR